METQFAAIFNTTTANINERRERTNNALAQVESDFASFKALVLSTQDANGISRINERREEANARREKLETQFAEYKSMVLAWSEKEVAKLVG